MGLLITFAIPYLHNRDYLRQAVASVVDQTLPDWELIIVDDSSDEPAGPFTDPRIRVERNSSRLGLVGNWNRCLTLGSAALVTLLHGDDRLHSAYAERVLAAAERWPDVVAIGTDVDLIDANGRPHRDLADRVKRHAHRPSGDHLISGDAGLSGLLRNNYLYSPTLCYRRTTIAAAGESPFDPRWAMVPDLDWISRQLLSGASIGVVGQPLYQYRRHVNSTSNQLTRTTQRFREEIELYQDLALDGAAKGWQATSRAARQRRMIRAHLGVRCLESLVRADPRAAAATSRLLISDLVSGRRLTSGRQTGESVSANTTAPKT